MGVWPKPTPPDTLLSKQVGISTNRIYGQILDLDYQTINQFVSMMEFLPYPSIMADSSSPSTDELVSIFKAAKSSQQAVDPGHSSSSPSTDDLLRAFRQVKLSQPDEGLGIASIGMCLFPMLHQVIE